MEQQHLPLDLKTAMELAYGTPTKIPWGVPCIPERLVELTESGALGGYFGGRALDLGCGLGENAIYLALRFYHVTGIDISNQAIELAKKEAKKSARRRDINLLTMDARNIGSLESSRFDFVLAWGLLHFIMLEDRPEFVRQLVKKVHPYGKLLLLTFSDNSPECQGRKHQIGTSGAPIYYSSKGELVKLFSPYFIIAESEEIDVEFPNKGQTHREHCLFMIRRRNIEESAK